ncbi:High-affinity methionine permease [Colletotrichum higginsianum IMI 349063]|uniref:High-affinity methionine permease n=1 Tax=Colletotrichum higginsianum (strain IMI 349063) TaxID=759273 RepID=A0A1B7XQV8_COLHI|nr:High-affinity methionine permease [Colletotrichum higginsianum IMI 349063]OBR02146.1 High-affinity methionine permease [Colletotrichum higginsianum IMI 349063]
MNDSPTLAGFDQEPHATDNDSVHTNDVIGVLGPLDDNDGNNIVTHAPKEGFRLGYFDVSCLVINRMIGTGIFMSPQRVMQGTRSVGASMLIWVAGMIYCLCGTHVYIEYGLNVPRYIINGVESSVPRSGGDLVYLQYVFRKPAYRKNTILLSTCIFGISFIILGNMAGNCIHFALRVMEAAGVENPKNGPVRGIALAAAIFACGVHAISRRFGILLNNTLAVMKIMIMLLIIIAAIIVGAGGFPNTPNVISANTSPKNSFKDASQEVNGYAQAFLAVIFTFSGFEQPNYVLGEISRPRRKFPIAMGTGVGVVTMLYLAVNICYLVVVSSDEQIEENVAQRFFELTYGRLGSGVRIFNAFLAISSMGNIIVMTYTAARVKQEIAKEGILPWPKLFARNTDMSIGRLIRWFQKKGWFVSLHHIRWLSPEHHSERTPVGALFLHFVSCVILLFATYGIEPTTAYVLLTSLSAYVINAFMATFLGLGILILRFCGPPRTVAEEDASTFEQESRPLTWAEMTGKQFRPFLSIFCALVYMCGGLYPVITNWVPPSGSLPSTVKPWYLVPTVSWVVIGIGIGWFFGFVLFARYIERKEHSVFVVEKKPEFEPAETSGRSSEASGTGTDLIQVHETVYLSWVGKEALRSRRPVFEDSKQVDGSVREVFQSPYVGTDFSAFMSNQTTPERGGYQ